MVQKANNTEVGILSIAAVYMHVYHIIVSTLASLHAVMKTYKTLQSQYLRFYELMTPNKYFTVTIGLTRPCA